MFKADLAIVAREHTALVENKWKKEIIWSIDNSKIYSPDDIINLRQDLVRLPISFSVKPAGSFQAAYSERLSNLNAKICILNFASYKNAGGGFLGGAMAQEEALCHDSVLYNILSAFDSMGYYDANKNFYKLNRGLYTNRAIYSPEVIFETDSVAYDRGPQVGITFDVLTCAAPNKSVGLKYGKFTEEENREALISRIKFILDIMSENHVDIPILGAFGCGVFRQDPYEVANIFMQLLSEFKYGFDHVVFAIPGGPNLKAFEKVIGELNQI